MVGGEDDQQREGDHGTENQAPDQQCYLPGLVPTSRGQKKTSGGQGGLKSGTQAITGSELPKGKGGAARQPRGMLHGSDIERGASEEPGTDDSEHPKDQGQSRFSNQWWA